MTDYAVELELTLAALIFALGVLNAGWIWRRYARVRIYELAILANGLFWGLGPWIAWLSGGMTLPASDTGLLWWTYGGVFFFMAGIWLAGYGGLYQAQRRYMGNESLASAILSPFSRLQEVVPFAIVICLVLVWGVRLIVGWRYGLWYSGSSLGRSGAYLPYVFVVLQQLSEALAWGLLAWGCGAIWQPKMPWQLRLLSLIVIGSELFRNFIHGRRWMVIWLAFIVLGYLASHRRLRFKPIAMMVGAVVMLYLLAFPFFLAVRDRNDFGGVGQDTAIESFIRGVQQAATVDMTEQRERAQASMSRRPLLLRNFVNDIYRRQDDYEPMYGGALVSTFYNAIPAALLPESYQKEDVEQAIQGHYRFAKGDASMTWVAMGVADGGLLGAWLTGLFLGGWLWLMERWGRILMTGNPLAGCVLAGGVVYCMLQVEISPVACWVLCRNILVLQVLFMLIAAAVRRPELGWQGRREIGFG